VAWNVELSEAAAREIDKLDPPTARRILKFLQQRVAKLDDPRSIGEALHGSKLGEFWKYRIGDFRLICSIEDKRLAGGPHPPAVGECGVRRFSAGSAALQ
jgi:mRNA interferase RelE/StbE